MRASQPYFLQKRGMIMEILDMATNATKLPTLKATVDRVLLESDKD